MKHFVYILKCIDKTLYTGYTTDINKRLREHNETKRGARYTKSRRPVELVYLEEFPDKSSAMKKEWKIKQLSRVEKIKML